uniref:PA domain-containing protein n=1 Tax=Spongospora subterranea TaxID=70186 RepID=A0A0H5RBZ3_9EUKA|eukprot:CRZ06013.1 hypothetical protein [Spongospora subterranea]
MSCLIRLVPLAIVAIVLTGTSRAGITFINGTLSGLNLYSTSFTRFIGTQYDDHINPITARMHLYDKDSCDNDQIDANAIIGSVVMVKKWAGCSADKVNDLFVRKGAVGIIVFSVFPPSIAVNCWDRCPECLPNTSDVPFMVLQESDDLVNAVADNPDCFVTIFPDYNIWEERFASWNYQIFVRWIPVILLIQIWITCAVFLCGHFQVIYSEYLASIKICNRSPSRFVRFLWGRLGYPQVALSVALLHASVMGPVLAIGGFFSTANLPGPVTLFFVTQSSGSHQVISIVSSAFWNSKVQELGRPASLLTRFLRGDSILSTVLLCLFVLLLDIGVGSLYATYFQSAYPVFDVFTSLVFLIIGVVLGFDFLSGAIGFQIECRKVSKGLGENVGPVRSDMDNLLHRLSYCAIGIGITLLIQSLAILALATPILRTAVGWNVVWGVILGVGYIKLTLIVHMFRPKRSSQQRQQVQTTSDSMPKGTRLAIAPHFKGEKGGISQSPPNCHR